MTEIVIKYKFVNISNAKMQKIMPTYCQFNNTRIDINKLNDIILYAYKWCEDLTITCHIFCPKDRFSSYGINFTYVTK